MNIEQLPQLLPEIGGNPNIRMLLSACDKNGPKDCALIPLNHCLHTPGGPLKVSCDTVSSLSPHVQMFRFLCSSIRWKDISLPFLVSF